MIYCVGLAHLAKALPIGELSPRVVVSGTPTAACYTDPMSWACLRPKLDIEHSCDAK